MEFTITNPHPITASFNQSVEEKHLASVEMLLVKAGHKILKDDLRSNWLKLSAVTRVLQKYHIQNNTLRTQRASKLEPLIIEYYEKHDLMKLDGVKIEFKLEKQARGQEKVFLRFHAHDLANDGPLKKVNWERKTHDN